MERLSLIVLILLAVCVTAYAVFGEKIVQQDNPLRRPFVLKNMPQEDENCCDVFMKRMAEICGEIK